ncbi:MAG: DegT/DnrJ/EryC1/StrS family aminotransferase [Bdellovibrionales bacterium]|nr:DegT/DnrJ/EryC1/StrS family aminotransferase [Bdellovibrionales bacterium]
METLTLPVIKEGRDSVYAQYTLRVEKRDRFQKELMELGVPTSIHYPKGMHQQPALEMYKPSSPLSVTETVCEQVISLPLYADMPEDHIAYVAEKVKQVAQKL